MRVLGLLATRTRPTLLHRLFFELLQVVLVCGVQLVRRELVLLFLNRLFLNQARTRRIR
jgi:hypothetical protein